jgi:hypothetical protein
MFIIVRAIDNVIVGSANNPVNVMELSKQGRRVYEIDDDKFSSDMIGQKIAEYEIL